MITFPAGWDEFWLKWLEGKWTEIKKQNYIAKFKSRQSLDMGKDAMWSVGGIRGQTRSTAS